MAEDTWQHSAEIASRPCKKAVVRCLLASFVSPVTAPRMHILPVRAPPSCMWCRRCKEPVPLGYRHNDAISFLAREEAIEFPVAFLSRQYAWRVKATTEFGCLSYIIHSRMLVQGVGGKKVLLELRAYLHLARDLSSTDE
jgi:hypothetical protein